MSNITTTTISSLVIQLNNARAGVQRIGQPILFSIGITGCILNILIFIRPTMRQNSCALYFHASSWANILCLTWGVLASMLAFFTKNNPASYNVIYCKIRFYMINFAQYSSRTFVILACLDRFLLCSTSVNQRLFCRPQIARKVIVFSTFICGCLPIYILATYQPGQTLLPCGVSTAAAATYELISSWLFLLGIPTILMSAFSALIVRRLKQNAKRVGREKIRVAGKDVQLSAMLIAQVLLYLATNLPYVIIILYSTLTEYIPTSNKSAERVASESFAGTFLTSFFYYCFNGLSFFAYTLTAPSFRRELISVIFPKKLLDKLRRNNDRNLLTAVHHSQDSNRAIILTNSRQIIKTEEKIHYPSNRIYPSS